MASAIDPAGVRVRPLAAKDLDEADRICRVAFGTFLGVPEPEKTFGEADLVRTRWQADPGAALAADADGRLAGSNFAANWGERRRVRPAERGPRILGSRHRAAAARRHHGPVRGPGLREVRRRPARACCGAHVRPADRRVSRAGRRARRVASGGRRERGPDRAWRALAGRGFRRNFQGVAMHRPNEPGYSTSDSYVIDDWR